MAEYAYRAAERAGRMQEGRLSADGLDDAMRQLRGKGLTPVRLEPVSADLPEASGRTGAAGEKWPRFGRSRPVNRQDVHALTGELAVMMRAGLPLDGALRILIGMSEKTSVRALLEDLLKSVKGGKGLSQALQAHHEAFGDFYINMIRAGEAGGHLSEVLDGLAEHLERLKVLRESVISALIYPAILLVVATLSILLMLGFVVPQFEALFEDMGDGLPLPTRIIVSSGHFIADWGWLLLIMTAAGVWLTRRWFATPSGQAWKDARMLRLPVLGNVVRKYELTRFARSMGTLLGNGVPIVMALRIASDTMSNRILCAAVSTVPAAIKQGGRLADALQSTGLFTPLALNMVRLGEETGRLDAMLAEVARVHDNDVQASVKRALTLLEPLLILLMGGAIAAIIVSILMGILSVNDLAM